MGAMSARLARTMDSADPTDEELERVRRQEIAAAHGSPALALITGDTRPGGDHGQGVTEEAGVGPIAGPGGAGPSSARSAGIPTSDTVEVVAAAPESEPDSGVGPGGDGLDRGASGGGAGARTNGAATAGTAPATSRQRRISERSSERPAVKAPDSTPAGESGSGMAAVPPGLPVAATIPLDTSGKAKLSCKVPRRLNARMRSYQQRVFDQFDTRLIRSAVFSEAVRRLLDDSDATAGVLERRAEAGRPREPMVTVTTDMPGELYREMLRVINRDGRGLPYTALFVAAVDRYLDELEQALETADAG